MLFRGLMNKIIKLSSEIEISYKKPPKIIAEISCNHNGSKKIFNDHIKSAAKNGADLVKIQTYEPEDITLKKLSKDFLIKKGIWKGKNLWKLYSKTQTPFKWHYDAFKICNDHNKIIFSSPFSLRAVDFLEKLNVKLYKIASFEMDDVRLVDYVAQTKKPIILSTGLNNISSITKTLKIIRKYHNNVILLHCVSGYPTLIENSNLRRIEDLKKRFNKNLIGLSDHTDSIYTSLASIPFKTCLIEKHFLINKKINSQDKLFSINPFQLRELSDISKKIHRSLNDNSQKNNEKQNEFFKRSLYTNKDVKKGELISEKNIVSLRPRIGINSSEFFNVLNRKFKKSLKAYTPIQRSFIS